MVVSRRYGKYKTKKPEYHDDLKLKMGEVEPVTESIKLGFDYELEEDIEYPALIKAIRRVNNGIVVELAVFAGETCDMSFFYKDGTTSYDSLRKFALRFEAYTGDLASIVGKCTLIVIKSTSYGFKYFVGMGELSLEEANTMIVDIKEQYAMEISDDSEVEDESEYDEDYSDDESEYEED